jgi:hypothetical protein
LCEPANRGVRGGSSKAARHGYKCIIVAPVIVAACNDERPDAQ